MRKKVIEWCESNWGPTIGFAGIAAYIAFCVWLKSADAALVIVPPLLYVLWAISSKLGSEFKQSYGAHLGPRGKWWFREAMWEVFVAHLQVVAIFTVVAAIGLGALHLSGFYESFISWGKAHPPPLAVTYGMRTALAFADIYLWGVIIHKYHIYRPAPPEAPPAPIPIPVTARERILAQYQGHLPTRVRDTIVNALAACVQPNPLSPDGQKQTEDAVVATAVEMLQYLEGVMPALQDEGPFKVPLIGSIKNFGYVVGEFLNFLWQCPPCYGITQTISSNRAAASTQQLKREQVLEGEVVQPRDFQGSNRDIVNAYLKHTPFQHLFDGDVAFGWKDPMQRFSHTWIVAPPKTGKTTLLKALAGYDLGAVERGEASLIIIDSEGQMLQTMLKLKIFDTVRFTVIDPEEDLALNPFTIGSLTEQSEDDVIELLTFMIAGLLEAEMTSRQRGVFNRLVSAMLRTPDATILTMMDVLTGEIKLDTSSWDDDDLRKYFANVFSKSSDVKEICGQLGWRVDQFLSRKRSLKRILSVPRNDLDFEALMNSPGVTYIHTNQHIHGMDGSAFIGRMCLAQIMRTGMGSRRGDEKDFPCHVYVDEADTVIVNDKNVPVLLNKIRKYNVGLVLAHQMLNLSAEVQSSLAQSSGTIMANTRGDDANYLSKYMGCEPWVLKCAQGEFAVWIRDQVESAIKLRVPGYVLEKMPQRRYTKPAPRPRKPDPEPEPITERPYESRRTIDADTGEDVAPPKATVAPHGPPEGNIEAFTGVLTRIMTLLEELLRRTPPPAAPTITTTYTPPVETPKKTSRGRKGYQGKKNNPNYTDSL